MKRACSAVSNGGPAGGVGVGVGSGGAGGGGAAARFGLALAPQHSRANSAGELLGDLQSAAALLRAARPTAVNLGWAIDRTLRVAREAASRAVDDVRRRV